MKRPQVMLVDDEPRVLEGYRRHLRKQFDISIIDSPHAALDQLADSGSFGVVVSDFRMPGMDGVQFLSEVRRAYPSITRVMLTGQADYQSTIEAVNRGNIFRFLSKPCSPEALASAIEDAMQLHELVTAEKELIEGTLTGAVSAMAELVGLTSPDALARSARIREAALLLAERGGIETRWELEIASSLSQVGCVTLPADVASAGLTGAQLGARDRALYEGHALVAETLVKKVPRLEGVAAMIGTQFVARPDPEVLSEFGIPVDVANVFRAAAVFAESSAQLGARAAIAAMMATPMWDGVAISDLEGLAEGPASMDPKVCSVADLFVGMVADQDMMTLSGVKLMSKGHEITEALLQRLRNFQDRVGIEEPVDMLVPRR